MAVNFATLKNLIFKRKMFPHCNIHTHTWTSPDEKAHNQINHVLIGKRGHSNIVDIRSCKGADCDIDHYLVVANVSQRPQ
jgi:hypothetical protein